MINKYLFSSKRLGFREWSQHDLEEFTALNANSEVMKHFPSPLSKKETQHFLNRLITHQKKHGFCYFAVETLSNTEFIGFIGLATQEYKSEFTPATDIGWRLKPSSWGKGYATEGAKRCLKYAFNDLKINKLIATCTSQNINSEKVMQKIGMRKEGIFNHPKLVEYPSIQSCICYSIEKNDIKNNPDF
ncbi:MAG: GNAT family N-acetyltransferase [Salibacteraceae bacterium]